RQKLRGDGNPHVPCLGIAGDQRKRRDRKIVAQCHSVESSPRNATFALVADQTVLCDQRRCSTSLRDGTPSSAPSVSSVSAAATSAAVSARNMRVPSVTSSAPWRLASAASPAEKPPA